MRFLKTFKNYIQRPGNIIKEVFWCSVYWIKISVLVQCILDKDIAELCNLRAGADIDSTLKYAILAQKLPQRIHFVICQWHTPSEGY